MWGSRLQCGQQVNIETARASADTIGTSGRFEFGLTLRSGNVELVEFEPAFRLDRSTNSSKQLVIVNGDIGWEGGERFSNSGLVHLRHESSTRSRFRPEFFAQTNYDLARNLSFRSLGGGGLRTRVLEDGSSRLFLSISYLLEHERNDLVSGDIHPARTTNHRISFYASAATRNDDSVGCTAVVYVQPRLPEVDDPRVLVSTRLGVAVGKHVEIVTTVRFQYDAGPPEDVGRADLQLVSGFSFAF